VSQLLGSDYRKVLGVLREAGEVDGDIPFPEPVLEALRVLVPCDVVAYHEHFDPRAERIVVWTGEPRGQVTEELRAAAERLADQDPLTPTSGPIKYSDFFSQREFHRLEVYQELARPLGVEDMMRVWLSHNGEGHARLEFDRPSRDFAERDRRSLELLLPHLKQFLRTSLTRRRWRAWATSAGDRLTPRESQILREVARGRTNSEIAWQLGISPETVRKHLENVYEKLGVHTRTAAVAVVFGLDRDLVPTAQGA